MAERPEPQDHGKADTSTYGPVRVLVEHWAEFSYWILVGGCIGGAVVMALVHQTNPAVVIGILSFFAIFFMLLGRREYINRSVNDKRRLDAWEREVRERVRDELAGDFEAKRQALESERDAAATRAATAIEKLSTIEAQAAARIAADHEWSAAPANFIELRPVECAVGRADHTIKFDIEVRNKFHSARTVWISANVGLYRKGDASGNALSIVPMCVCSVDVAGDSNKIVTQPLHSTIPNASIAAVEAALSLDGGELEAKLIDMRAATIINLTGKPATHTLPGPILSMKPIPVTVY